MKLKSKFLLFILIVHGCFLSIAFIILPISKTAFTVAELLILFSAGISIWFHQTINRTFSLISFGIESLKDKDFNTRLVAVGNEEIHALILVYNQMIDRLREERVTSTEMNFFLYKLIQASPAGILILNNTNKIESANAAASQIFNTPLENIVGIELTKLGTEFSKPLHEFKDNESDIISYRGLQLFKCSKSHFIDKGHPHYFILLEELTEVWHKKEKQAYEKVIRMMSHEINNSIGGINSILRSCLQHNNNLISKHDYEEALQVAIERNTHLSKFMSNFASVVRLPEPDKQLTDVNKLIKNVQMLMSGFAISKRIEWVFHLTEEPMLISMDTAQMEQVLGNIIKNAIEAIDDAGKIILATNVAPLQLAIVDNGKGLPLQDPANLFTPFYSTKKNGQGIGLTLAKEILINHHFKFSLTRNTDDLTVFEIIF